MAIQRTKKPAIFAMTGSVTPRVGLEPTRENSQSIVNKGLTENRIPVLSTSLDILLRKHPEVKQIIDAWPELPKHIKQTIIALIQTYAQGVQK